MRKLIIVILTALALPPGLPGQEPDPDMVKYTPDFRFTDGIYVNFEQVQKNSPIPKAKIVTSADYNSRDFFDQIFENESVYYYDGMGVRQELSKNDLWGYSRNGILYYQLQGEFHRITFVGKLCHFVADITTIDRRYYGSPYGSYYDPYYYSRSSYYNYYSPYSYYNPYAPVSTTRNELKQYIIDFETGNRLEYDVKNVEMLLMKDPVLYDEYIMLPKKKKRQMAFYYIRKYNERNPLYIPKN